jgi:hypothetical protein
VTDQKTGEEERGAPDPRTHDAHLRCRRGGVSRPLASEGTFTLNWLQHLYFIEIEDIVQRKSEPNTGLDAIGSSSRARQLAEPQQLHEWRVWLTSPTAERGDQRFNRRVGMTVERAQINWPIRWQAGQMNSATDDRRRSRRRCASGTRARAPLRADRSG